MNCAFYILGNPDGKYEQYPSDYTSELLEKQVSDLKRVRFCICRKDTLIHYIYINKTSVDNYVGLCLIFNKVQTVKYAEMIQIFDKVIFSDVINNLIDAEGNYIVKSFLEKPSVYKDLECIVNAELSNRIEKSLISLNHAYTLSETKQKCGIASDDSYIYNLTSEYKNVELNSEDDITGKKRKFQLKNKRLHIVYLIILLLLGGTFKYFIDTQSEKSQNEIEVLNKQINGLENDNRELQNTVSTKQNSISLLSDSVSTLKEYKNMYNNLISNPSKLIELAKKEPFIVLDIEIRNEGESYNQTIYSKNTTRLTGKIHYVGLKNQNIKLKIKLYCNGELSHGGGTWYREDYSFDGDISVTNNVVSSEEIGYWGTDEKGQWPSGDYRYEVWYNNKCFWVKYFTIY